MRPPRFDRKLPAVPFLKCLLVTLAASIVAPPAATAALRDVEIVALGGRPAPGSGGTFFNVFGNDFFLTSERRIAFGSGVTGAVGTPGYWGGSSSALSLLGLTDQPAPGAGGQTFDFLASTHFINADQSGNIAILGGRRTGNTFHGLSIWVGTATGISPAVASEGAPAPGTPGTFLLLSRSNPPVISEGRIAFFATITGDPDDVNSDNDSGIWAGYPDNLLLMVRENDAMPEQPTGATFGSFSRPILTPNNRLIFIGNAHFGVTATALYRTTGSGTLEVVADRDHYDSFGKVAANATGQVAFIAIVGVFTNLEAESESGIRTVASLGQPAPDADGEPTSATITEFLHHILLDDGAVLFLGETSEGKRGIWREVEGDLRRVVLEGEVAPGTSGATFTDIKNVAASADAIVFEATTTAAGSNSGVWRVRPSGVIVPVLLPLDTIEVAPGDVRTVQAARGPTPNTSIPADYGTGADGYPHFLQEGVLLLQAFFNSFTSSALVLVDVGDDLIVNATGNEPDTDPGDGVCDTGGPPVDGEPRCTLRAAIQESNARLGRDRIRFDVPATDPGYSDADGTWFFDVVPPLPIISDPVWLDGTSQPGFAGKPLVHLDGGLRLSNDNRCFLITAGDCTVEGIAITRFFTYGIGIEGPGENVIRRNHIGVSPSGLVEGHNGEDGIRISGSSNNTIGGIFAVDGNVIASNGISGTSGSNVLIQGASSAGNIVTGNYIGTDATGNGTLLNSPAGVRVIDAHDNIIGGQTALVRNVIGGNALGISIEGPTAAGNRIEGNWIGLGASGVNAVSNTQAGIMINGAPNTLIGGPVAAPGEAPGNIVSGNRSESRVVHGIDLRSVPLPATIIQGNKIGLSESTVLPNGGDGIHVRQSPGTSIGTSNPLGLGRNVIAANDSSGIVIETESSESVNVERNYIGVFANGITAAGNGADGIRVVDAGRVRIASNVIAGSVGYGVVLRGEGASDGLVEGNYIGVSEGGGSEVANQRGGVLVDGAPSAQIGGHTAPHATSNAQAFAGDPDAQGNLISGNRSLDSDVAHGIFVRGNAADGAEIYGNMIGLAPEFGVPYPNGGDGIHVTDVRNVTIGDLMPGGGNVVSGNESDGIVLEGAATTGAVVRGNLIGVQRNGIDVTPNVRDGIRILGSSGNVLEGNTVGGNGRHGIFLEGASAAMNTLRSNYVGTDSTATFDQGNDGDGIRIEGASETRIESNAGLPQHRVWYNLGTGIRIHSGDDNRVRGGSIFDNGRLGIDLGAAAGVTANDALDVDDGANRFQNYPVVMIAHHDTLAKTLLIRGILEAQPGTDYSIQIFGSPSCDAAGYGEGRDSLATESVFTDETGRAAFSYGASIADADVPSFVTVTATDLDGNTSEFSTCREVELRSVVFIVNSANDAGDLVVGDGICDTGGVVGSEPECTLRAALEETSAFPGTQTIEFDVQAGPPSITPLSPLPPVADVTIDGSSQPGYDGQPSITLDGSSAGDGTAGLTLQGGAHVIALGIGNFRGDGIVIAGGESNSLAYCYVGVARYGPDPRTNAGSGVRIVGGSRSRIGGPGAANQIAFNGVAGVRVEAGSAHSIRENSIFSNGMLGIDLVGGSEDASGTTANDAGDVDSGPNDLQNTPLLERALLSTIGLEVQGLLTGAPTADFEIQLFASELCDESGHGEASVFLGSFAATTDASGIANLDITLGLDALSPEALALLTSLEGWSIAATATDSNGSTSEFSNCTLAEVTPVALIDFEATSDYEGIRIRWRATFESDPVSYRLERRPADDSGSPWEIVEERHLPDDLEAGVTHEIFDRNLERGTVYEYTFTAWDRSGIPYRFGPVRALWARTEHLTLRAVRRVEGGATFRLDLPRAGETTLAIYDVSGRLVRTLLDRPLAAGFHEIEWDGRNETRGSIGSGVFFARVVAEDGVVMERVVVTR